MSYAISTVPTPVNEPIKGYLPGSPERKALEADLATVGKGGYDIPLFIGGREVRTGDTAPLACPHKHSLKLGVYHRAGVKEVEAAARAAREAAPAWAALPYEQRLSVFLKAAELLTGKYRYLLNAATMIGQSKNAFQAEIDSACELIDFWRFNPYYATRIYQDQPISAPGIYNRVEYRPLEGFVFAVTPFNFTSIAGNLPAAPAMMGCTVLWKPASSSVLSAWYVLQILQEAGLPAGVINMIPGSGAKVGDPVLAHPDLAGIHFTGSTSVFQGMWKTVGENIANYRSYPRIVGETGGKDFIFAHESADEDALITAAIRGAFEFQGQKCSAASRLYVPEKMWKRIQGRLVDQIESITMGDPADYRNFMGAVIDKGAFNSISGYIEGARKAKDAKIIAGGKADGKKGWFIRPTLIQTSNPRYRTICEEIFGPVLTVYPYKEKALQETLALCDTASPYSLTGAIFARDRLVISQLTDALANAAGNFYINDKPTGAVVGQQPFGGARASGTNDKAGSYLNLLRWVSCRAIKENFAPPTTWTYPYMAE
jgi:1-pyrroline-5-carboxylate dehydrogenase